MSDPLKIATWNVNSMRVRLPHILEWLAAEKPAIVGLQETKTEDKNFPQNVLETLGYHVVFSGEKTYNGVALLTRQPVIELANAEIALDETQCRLLAATIGNLRIINLYVPNGASVGSEKYFYKLSWLTKLKHYLIKQLQEHPRLIVMGDFNIAPDDRDVYDPKAWEDQVLVSMAERQLWQEILALGLVDSFRLFSQASGHYTWWDYRAAAWRRNLGLRIDHILISQALVIACQHCHIDKIPRGWERPSDHAPVIASFTSL